MKYSDLGQTGITVSALGLGTVKFGRNQQVKYPDTFDLPDDQAIRNLLSLAKDQGINLLDTAPAYGSSEARLGQLLRPADRQQWIICTKVGEEFINGQSSFHFTPSHVKASIQRSLLNLATDYLDIVLVHSDGNDCDILERYQIFSLLAKLKQQGVIRAYGMSTKTLEGGLACVEHADIAMVTYNPCDTKERMVLDKAQQHKKGILIKKALASGHLYTLADSNPIETSLQFIFQHPAVNSVIIGTINPKHLLENIACMLTVENL
jgi:aryl-alcohol dehydrogenase-like predicted oxidoreductase